jgi:hypothetical protein
MFCAPGPVFGGIEGVGSRFHVLRSRTHFRRYRRRRVPFSYFALRDPFLAVPRAWGPVFMFCAHRPVFGDAKCVGSCFHILHTRTHFRRYRWRLFPLLGFALSDSFSAVPRSSTHFRRFRGRWVLFSCFDLPNPFSAVPRASGAVFMSCTP